jgi:hypothetical protein
MSNIWELLGERVAFIRGLYRRYNIQLKPGEGLSQALEEAESLVRGEQAQEFLTESEIRKSIEQIHVIMALGEVLEICVSGGLDVSSHLRQISTGSTDYGTPDTGSGKSIYYKDFELELFIAAALLREGLNVKLLTLHNDPRGDLKFGNFFIEVKHPNSLGQLEKLLRKFNGRMKNNNTFGAFVVGIEDAFGLGDKSEFHTREEYDAWLRSKREDMELFGLPLIERAARLPRIGAIVQIQSKIEIVERTTNLKRLSNSCVFDHRAEYDHYSDDAIKIAKVFNSNPRRYSLLQKSEKKDNMRK